MSYRMMNLTQTGALLTAEQAFDQSARQKYPALESLNPVQATEARNYAQDRAGDGARKGVGIGVLGTVLSLAALFGIGYLTGAVKINTPMLPARRRG